MELLLYHNHLPKSSVNRCASLYAAQALQYSGVRAWTWLFRCFRWFEGTVQTRTFEKSPHLTGKTLHWDELKYYQPPWCPGLPQFSNSHRSKSEPEAEQDMRLPYQTLNPAWWITKHSPSAGTLWLLCYWRAIYKDRESCSRCKQIVKSIRGQVQVRENGSSSCFWHISQATFVECFGPLLCHYYFLPENASRQMYMAAIMSLRFILVRKKR